MSLHSESESAPSKGVEMKSSTSIEPNRWDRHDGTDIGGEAESTLVAILEKRDRIHRQSSLMKDESSRSLLGAVPPEAEEIFDRETPTRRGDDYQDSSSVATGQRSKLVDIALEVRALNRLKRGLSNRQLNQKELRGSHHDSSRDGNSIGDFVPSAASPSVSPHSRRHRRSKTLGDAPFNVGESPFTEVVAAPIPRQENTFSETDQLFENAQRVERLFQIPETESVSSFDSAEDNQVDQGGVEEKESKDADEETATLSETTPLHTSQRSGPSSTKKTNSKCYHFRCLMRLGRFLRRRRKELIYVLRPRQVLSNTIKFLVWTVLAVMVPFMTTAAVLYYRFGNPSLQFLPSNIPVSWWLIFAVRQLTILQLARCTEYVFVDVFSLRSTLSVRVLGPLFTLFAIQSTGWPFVLSFWGVWDLVLLQGNTGFMKNWFGSLDIAMLSDQNPDFGILESNMYFRLLWSMVLVGVTTAIKRTYLALYLGRRTFIHYKPQLETIMADMKLLAEVADLAAETERPEFSEMFAQAQDYVSSTRSRAGDFVSSTRASKTKWDISFHASKKQEPESEISDDELTQGSEELDDEGNETTTFKSLPHASDRKVQWNRFRAKSDGSQDKIKRDVQFARGSWTGDKSMLQNHPDRQSFRKTNSIIKIKSLLDRWQEPENKQDQKNANPSIHDILQFRKALTYIEESHPFSLSFGRADTRDHCIKSAQRVYRRLLKYTPGASTLAFDVIGVLAYNEREDIDENKTKALVELFRPDKDDAVTLLAFVQACDWVYKNLRYFRASVANSTLIDKVLEQMFNGIFYFVLLLIVMSVMDYNPWTLLVSLSTVVVSVAFAVGPSAAKYIEGILLIAVRRPFDIGDRIKIASAELVRRPGAEDTWIVEDITLTTTTLRFATTNEVSTVNNYAIANSRLVNGARSQCAIVTINILLDVNAAFEQIEAFRSTVESFVTDRPHMWKSIVHFRIEKIDVIKCYVECTLRLQHVEKWQETDPILINQGELLKFCHEVAKKIGILYVPGPSETKVFLEESKEKSADDSEKHVGFSSIH